MDDIEVAVFIVNESTIGLRVGEEVAELKLDQVRVLAAALLEAVELDKRELH